jgi:hypothetical protein
VERALHVGAAHTEEASLAWSVGVTSRRRPSRQRHGLLPPRFLLLPLPLLAAATAAAAAAVRPFVARRSLLRRRRPRRGMLLRPRRCGAGRRGALLLELELPWRHVHHRACRLRGLGVACKIEVLQKLDSLLRKEPAAPLKPAAVRRQRRAAVAAAGGSKGGAAREGRGKGRQEAGGTGRRGRRGVAPHSPAVARGALFAGPTPAAAAAPCPP